MNSRFLSVVCVLAVALGASLAEAKYQAKGKRDPFVPLLTPEGQRIHPPGLDEEVAAGISGLVLQGIVFDEKAECYAIINGQVLRPHDRIEGMEILKIEPTVVTILAQGQHHRLTLRQQKEEKETP